MNLFSKNHLSIFGVVTLVVFMFYFKPTITTNNFIEIGINSLIITFIFIGGNYLLKSSKEMNQLIDTTWNKFVKNK